MEELILKTIIKVLEDKKCEDIVTYNVSLTSPLCSYIVIATIINPRQGKAISEAIEEAVIKCNSSIRGIEGDDKTPWILIDQGDIIIHLFTELERERINLQEVIERSLNK